MTVFWILLGIFLVGIMTSAWSLARAASRKTPRLDHNVCECGAWISTKRCYCDFCTETALLDIEAQWERFGPKRSA